MLSLESEGVDYSQTDTSRVLIKPLKIWPEPEPEVVLLFREGYTSIFMCYLLNLDRWTLSSG